MLPAIVTGNTQNLDRSAEMRQWRVRHRWLAPFVRPGLALFVLVSAIPAVSAEPVEAIGRLNFAGFRDRMHCTAALIAPNRALTAAHCLLQRAQPGNIHFLPGFAPLGWIENLPLADWVADTEKRDVALLCLSRNAQMAPLPRSARGPTVGELLTVIGYPVPRPYIQSIIGCAVEHVDGHGSFTLSCPLRPGASGAPVLRRTESGREIVGIVSATTATHSRAFDTSQEQVLPVCE